MLDYIVDGLVVNRYGGLRGLSTTHALIDIVHTWLLAAEEGKLDTWSFGLPKSFRSRELHSVTPLTSPILSFSGCVQFCQIGLRG